MIPNSEHAFYAWLIVISAVCAVTLIGAAIDRFYLNRRLGIIAPKNVRPTTRN